MNDLHWISLNLTDSERAEFETFPGKVSSIAAAAGYCVQKLLEKAKARGIEDPDLDHLGKWLLSETDALHARSETMHGIVQGAHFVNKECIGREVGFVVSSEEQDAFAKALAETEYLLGAARQGLDVICQGIAGGFLTETGEIQALCELMKRAFHHAGDHEGDALGRLYARISKGDRHADHE